MGNIKEPVKQASFYTMIVNNLAVESRSQDSTLFLSSEIFSIFWLSKLLTPLLWSSQPQESDDELEQIFDDYLAQKDEGDDDE